MIPRKKRLRYKVNAEKIAKQKNIRIDLNSWEEIWKLLDTEPEPTYLYAIGRNFGVAIKFGKSKQPLFRLKQIRAYSPDNVVLLGFCLEKSPLTEKEVHEKLKPYRLKGEWFYRTPEVEEILEQIKANQEKV